MHLDTAKSVGIAYEVASHCSISYVSLSAAPFITRIFIQMHRLIMDSLCLRHEQRTFLQRCTSCIYNPVALVYLAICLLTDGPMNLLLSLSKADCSLAVALGMSFLFAIKYILVRNNLQTDVDGALQELG